MPKKHWEGDGLQGDIDINWIFEMVVEERYRWVPVVDNLHVVTRGGWLTVEVFERVFPRVLRWGLREPRPGAACRNKV